MCGSLPWRSLGACAALLLTGAPFGVLALGSASVPSTPSVSTAAARGTTDAELVYCLATGQRPALIEAASVLGLVERGGKPGQIRVRRQGTVSEESVDDWRAEREPDFARACKALFEVANVSDRGIVSPSPISGASTGIRAILNVLLPVATGAILTLLAGEWRAGRERNRATAGTLRDLGGRFHQAVSAYAVAQETTATAKPATDTVQERRGDLLMELRRLSAVGANRAYLQALVDELDGPKYRTRLQSGWPNNMAERKQRADTLRHLVDYVVADVERVASAVERPWKEGRRMLRKNPSSPSVPFE